MKGNFQVRFLGEGAVATSPPYPTPPEKLETRSDPGSAPGLRRVCGPRVCEKLETRSDPGSGRVWTGLRRVCAVRGSATPGLRGSPGKRTGFGVVA